MQLCIVASILLLQIDSSTNAQIATKIVGGQMDASDTATYQISLQGLVEKGANSNSNNSNGTTVRKYYHFCSGSIVSRQHVLTAAHCLAGWRAEQLRVVAGTKVWNSPEGIPHAVANIEIHNRYKKLNGHDIGMVSMKKLFVFSERVSLLNPNEYAIFYFEFKLTSTLPRARSPASRSTTTLCRPAAMSFSPAGVTLCPFVTQASCRIGSTRS